MTGWTEYREKITEIQTADGDRFKADAIILATGHSARDIFQLLQDKKKEIHAKPFALGLRVEHPQELINSITISLYKRTGSAGNGIAPGCLSACPYRKQPLCFFLLHVSGRHHCTCLH